MIYSNSLDKYTSAQKQHTFGRMQNSIHLYILAERIRLDSNNDKKKAITWTNLE